MARNSKSKSVAIIVESVESTVDFVGFIDEVLSYPMVKGGKFACFVVLEVPKSKPVDPNVSK